MITQDGMGPIMIICLHSYHNYWARHKLPGATMRLRALSRGWPWNYVGQTSLGWHTDGPLEFWWRHEWWLGLEENALYILLFLMNIENHSTKIVNIHDHT